MNRTVFTAELGFNADKWRSGFRSARSEMSLFQRGIGPMMGGLNMIEKGFTQVDRVIQRGMQTVQKYGRILKYTMTGLVSYATYSGLKFNAAFESAELGLISLTGSAQKAKKFMKDLRVVSDGSPLRFTNVLDSARTMLGFEMSTERTVKSLTALNKAIIATGGGAEQFKAASLALGQMSASGKASKEDLNQLVNAGVPVNKILQRELGLTGKQVAEIGKEAVGADKVIDAITRGWTKKFGKAAEDAKDSWAFQTGSMIKDWEKFVRIATKPLFEKLRVDVLPVARKMLSDITNVFSSSYAKGGGAFAFKNTWRWISESFDNWLTGGGEQEIADGARRVGEVAGDVIMGVFGVGKGAGDNPFFKAGSTAITSFGKGLWSNTDVGDIITSPFGKALIGYFGLKLGPKLGKALLEGLGGVASKTEGVVGKAADLFMGKGSSPKNPLYVFAVNGGLGGPGGGLPGDGPGTAPKGRLGRSLDWLAGGGKGRAALRGGAYTLAGLAGGYAGKKVWWDWDATGLRGRKEEKERDRVARLEAAFEARTAGGSGNKLNDAILKGYGAGSSPDMTGFKKDGKQVPRRPIPEAQTGLWSAIQGKTYAVRDPKFPGGLRYYGGEGKAPKGALSEHQLEAYKKGIDSGARDPITGANVSGKADSTMSSSKGEKALANRVTAMREQISPGSMTKSAKDEGKRAGDIQARTYAAALRANRPVVQAAGSQSTSAFRSGVLANAGAANNAGKNVASQFAAGVESEKGSAASAAEKIIKGITSVLTGGVSALFGSGGADNDKTDAGTGDAPGGSLGKVLFNAGKALGSKIGGSVNAGVASAIGDAPGGAIGMDLGDGSGDWGGTKPIIERLAAMSGLPVTSTKRGTKNTASGGISDHWVGSKNSYAADLGTGPSPKADAIAQRLAAAIGGTWTPGQWMNVNRGGYRFQLGWRVPGHFDHIHIGARKLHGGGTFRVQGGTEGLALLRDGERVIPASGNPHKAAGPSSVSVTVTGNEFHVRGEGDISSIASALADQIEDALNNRAAS